VLTSYSILLLATLPFQSPAWHLIDRASDQFVDSSVRMVRIDDERIPDERQRGSTPERHLERIVAYDRTGRIVQQVEFGSYPELCVRSRSVYSYDEKGNRNQTVSWGSALEGDKANTTSGEVLTSRQTWTWDNGMRSADIVDYDASGKPYSKTVYRYDENNRVKEISQSFGVSPASTCRLTYNSLGLVSQEICERGAPYSAETKNYTYEVDSRGNWIKRITSQTATIGGRFVNQGGRIAYRQIEYYSTDGNPEKAALDIDRQGAKPCPPLVVRKSGGVFQQSASKRVQPLYPQDAKEKRVSGSVVVELTTDQNGKVISVKTISGPAELRGAAEDAARQWEFTPTTLSKVPVRVVGVITFNFNL
jgi:TonB family protein